LLHKGETRLGWQEALPSGTGNNLEDGSLPGEYSHVLRTSLASFSQPIPNAQHVLRSFPAHHSNLAKKLNASGYELTPGLSPAGSLIAHHITSGCRQQSIHQETSQAMNNK
jgi:hypothetical protein